MKGIEYDTSGISYSTVLRDWQLKALKVVWNSPNGANSRVVYEKVSDMLGDDTISRASIINFLESMRDMNVLNGEDRTGKGGHHMVYHANYDESGFRRLIADTLVHCLLENFPEETRKVIESL
jgi:hypothetical protein